MSRTFKKLVGYFIFLLVTILLGGCAIIDKAKQQHQEKVANRFFNEHPDKDAQRCHDHFPVRDSSGDIHLDSVHYAFNIDYTPDIDDLLSYVDSLHDDSINRYWIMVLDSSTTEMGNAFRKILLQQQTENDLLKQKLQQLHDAYKPCKPDSLFFTFDHWYVDPTLITINDALQKQNSELNKKLAAATSVSKVRLWMLIAAGAIILLLIVILYNTIRLKSKLTIPHL